MIYPWRASAKPAGGGGYTAPAVHLDGSAYLSTASLTSPDNEFFSCSYWIKVPAGSDFLQIFTAYSNDAGYLSNDNVSNASPNIESLIDLYDATGTISMTGDRTYTPDVWHSVITAAKTNLPAGEKIFVCYIDDILAFSSPSEDLGGSYTAAFNGLQFFLGSDPFNDTIICDMADVWIAPGVSLLTGSAIATADRRKFISAGGKPVNPSGFPSASLLFSGNASTFGINQGSGGVFTQTGILTNASTSPSD